MKICVPTNGSDGMKDTVCEHFGRAPTFTVVDTESGKVNVLPNTSEHMGGVGKPPEQIAGTGAEVMICSGLGPRAVQMFESYGIRVYLGASGSVKNAIDLWKTGKLVEATQENACKEHRH
jgi:predicted Fe-Mo cluster-binding NifX family protein